MTYFNFHGNLPGYDNRKIRGGSNDIDPDKEAFSMAPHGDEAYERVHMEDHEHEGLGSFGNRHGNSNPYSSGGDHYDDDDPSRYGALPPRVNAPLFDSETEYRPAARVGSPAVSSMAGYTAEPPTASNVSSYHPPTVETAAQFPQANYDRVDR